MISDFSKPSMAYECCIFPVFCFLFCLPCHLWSDISCSNYKINKQIIKDKQKILKMTVMIIIKKRKHKYLLVISQSTHNIFFQIPLHLPSSGSPQFAEHQWSILNLLLFLLFQLSCPNMYSATFCLILLTVAAEFVLQDLKWSI